MSTAPPTAQPTSLHLVITAAEHHALVEELRGLRARRDSEDDAEQTVTRSRIADIEDLLATATLLEDGAAVDAVCIGCAVEVEYVRAGKRVVLRLVGSGTRLALGVVSARSPIGQALMGRRAGETVIATLPSGREEPLRIVAIEPPA